ncbi:ABC transporter substrate-binding protein [Microbacterium gubbeenense]|uniref:ABC transporter substrate-binding protein n=2 Tax=Microbacterium gubbeenense TaxID=159896 RepID=UPI003F9BDEB2
MLLRATESTAKAADRAREVPANYRFDGTGASGLSVERRLLPRNPANLDHKINGRDYRFDVSDRIVGYNDSLEPWPYDLDKAKELVEEAKADGTPVDTKIIMPVRTAQFPKVSELGEVLREQISQAGLDIELRMVDTTQHLQYQTQPFVTDEGPIAMLIQHGNQAGDAQFSVEQYTLTGAAQAEFGDPELDKLIEAAAKLTGDERQAAYEEVFQYEHDNVVALAPIAHQTVMLALSDRVTYEPNSSTGDELRIKEVSLAG